MVGHVLLKISKRRFVLFQTPRGISSGTGTPMSRPHLVDHFSKDGSSHPKKTARIQWLWRRSSCTCTDVPWVPWDPPPEIHKIPPLVTVNPPQIFSQSLEGLKIYATPIASNFSEKIGTDPTVFWGWKKGLPFYMLNFPMSASLWWTCNPHVWHWDGLQKKKASSWKIWMEQWYRMLL